eukprot:scaffold21911_cov99-Isochrysis_galbana.AAC.3
MPVDSPSGRSDPLTAPSRPLSRSPTRPLTGGWPELGWATDCRVHRVSEHPAPAPHVRAGTQRPEMKDVACGWGGAIERFWDDPWPSRPFAKDPPHPSDMRQATYPRRTIRC